MKKSEIENQLGNAEKAAMDAVNRFEEAKRSAEELMAKSKLLVDERSKSLDMAKEEKNLANGLAANLASTFQTAKSKLECKCAEVTCTMNKISYLRNAYMNYYGQYQAAHLARVGQETLLSNPSNTPEQRDRARSQIQQLQQAEDRLRKWMEKYYTELCRQSARLPKIEQEVKEFEKVVNEVRPKLELANHHLEEAREREKRADNLLQEAMAAMDHNKELGQVKINEATMERDRCLQLVEYWKRALSSANNILTDYVSKQYE